MVVLAVVLLDEEEDEDDELEELEEVTIGSRGSSNSAELDDDDDELERAVPVGSALKSVELIVSSFLHFKRSSIQSLSNGNT